MNERTQGQSPRGTPNELADIWETTAQEFADEAGAEVSTLGTDQRAYSRCLKTCAEQLRTYVESPVPLEWKRGPNNGGEGTAGIRDGHGWWWDGDLLLCVVNMAGGGRDVFVGHVQADGDMISLTFPESGDDTGWLPDDLSWYAKIEGLLPPMDQ